jgi:cell division protein FtsB
MKVKELRKLVREAIDEVLQEQSPEERAAKDAEIKALQAKKKAIDARISSVNSGKDDMAEMARKAKGFALADPEIDSAQFSTRSVSGVTMDRIIDFFRENPGAEKTQLQAEFGFRRPQIANAIVNALKDSGVLVKMGAEGEVEPDDAGPAAPKATDPEDLFMGAADDALSMYFDNEPNADGSEDFNDEEEPTVDDIETVDAPAGAMSDEDYEAFDKYTTLKQRLDATKSNILKMRRTKNAAGDIKDKPSTELVRLRDLKQSLEDRIDTLVQGSPYLQKRLGIEPTPVEPVIEPEELEDEPTVAEGLDEYTIRKMQYYAGIRK